jgi:hydroxylaminobenzene mutase
MMNAESDARRRVLDARHLVRTAACLFGLSLINGFAIQATRLPRLALSAHQVGLIGSAFLFGLAGLWPRLTFPPRVSQAAAGLAIYGFVAGWLVYLTAAVSGAAGLFPLAGSGTKGGALAETLMSTALLTVALALFALAYLIVRHARSTGSASNAGQRFRGDER